MLRGPAGRGGPDQGRAAQPSSEACSVSPVRSLTLRPDLPEAGLRAHVARGRTLPQGEEGALGPCAAGCDRGVIPRCARRIQPEGGWHYGLGRHRPAHPVGGVQPGAYKVPWREAHMLAGSQLVALRGRRWALWRLGLFDWRGESLLGRKAGRLQQQIQASRQPQALHFGPSIFLWGYPLHLLPFRTMPLAFPSVPVS